MNIIRLDERESTTVQIVDFLSDDNEFTVFPEIFDKQYVEFSFVKSKVKITAGKYIGLIPLNNKYSLYVKAKVPIDNLVNILSTARATPLLIEGLERAYSSDEDADFFELLVCALHQEIREIERYGVHREYVMRLGNRGDFKGKLMVGQTLGLWAKGVYNRTAMTYFEFSRDVIINQAIKYTIWYVLRIYPTIAQSPKRQILIDLYNSLNLFQDVSLQYDRRFLPDFKDIVLGNKLPYARSYLKKTLQYCLMILDNLGVDLDQLIKHDVYLPPLVINMEIVFQQFLLRIIREKIKYHSELVCWDTSRENQYSLFRKPEVEISSINLEFSEKAKANPDFTIARNNSPLLICDAKYTLEIERGQINQVVAHAKAYNVNDALLIYPTSSPNQPPESCCRGMVGDIRIFTFMFPLDSPDLQKTAELLVDTMVSIINNTDDNRPR